MPKRQVKSADGHIWLVSNALDDQRGVEMTDDFLDRYERVMGAYKALQEELIDYDNAQYYIDYPHRREEDLRNADYADPEHEGLRPSGSQEP